MTLLLGLTLADAIVIQSQQKTEVSHHLEVVAPLIVIDVEQKVLSDPRYTVTAQDILEWESSHGRLPEAAIIQTHTGGYVTECRSQCEDCDHRRYC